VLSIRVNIWIFSWIFLSYHSVLASLMIQGTTFSKQPWGLDMLGVAFVVP
jgi:hypothetical protein